MRRLITTTTALLALAAPLLAAAPSSAAPPDVQIKPGTITRGADVAGAHLEGKTIVDGDVHVTLKAPRVLLYGKSDDVYVVATGDKEWGNVKLWQVTASGATTQLAKFIDPFNTLLDADGGQVAYSYGDSTSKPTIAVYDLNLEDEVSVNAFASLPTLLDFDEGTVVASFFSFKVKTITWDTVADVTLKVNMKVSNFASQAHDLLGFFSKDPFNGGCQVLTHLSDPTNVIWTNCDERIEAISPDGKRVATIALLSDGIGPADVMVRKLSGAPVVHYSINGWFGRIWWETGTKLLMESNGKTQSAIVRCKVDVCDRASDLAPTPDL
jgi:hypothetical protein